MQLAHHAATRSPTRIGPNAIIQTLTALGEEIPAAEVRRFVLFAGRPDLADQLPSAMIDEQEFIALIAALRGWYGLAGADRVLERAGELTANYLLANRIPGPVQLLLRLLPDRLAIKLLLAAISRHAWTFAGSAQFSYTTGATTVVRLRDCVEARNIASEAPLCHFYHGAFQRLFRALISPRATVYETECAACGADSCQFEVH